MSDQPQYDVFLAHNSQDKPQVRAVAKELRQRGLNPWLDEDVIAPGRWFQDVIQQAIPDVKSAAIFIGPGGLGKWQAVELRAFISQCVEADIPVIPVLLPGVNKLPTHLLFLSQLNWVRFTSGIDDVEAMDNLEWGITGWKPELTSQANSPVIPHNPPVTKNNKQNIFRVFSTIVAGITTVIVTLLSAYYLLELNAPSTDSFKTITVDARSTTGTQYTLDANKPARVKFKAHGTWLAIPDNYNKEKNLPRGFVPADGYSGLRGNQDRYCSDSNLGALAVTKQDGKCITTGSEGTLDLQPGETVIFRMSDNNFSDNEGEMTVELFKAKK